jgi:hypothetical protein
MPFSTTSAPKRESPVEKSRGDTVKTYAAYLAIRVLLNGCCAKRFPGRPVPVSKDINMRPPNKPSCSHANVRAVRVRNLLRHGSYDCRSYLGAAY